MSIQNYLNQIKSAVFGKDVRQSIHDAIKQCYDDASIDHDNANMEVKLARGSHDTLNERFTSVEENIKNTSEQLDNSTQYLKSGSYTYTNFGKAFQGGSPHVSWAYSNVHFDKKINKVVCFYVEKPQHHVINCKLLMRHKDVYGDFTESKVIADKLSQGISCRSQASAILNNGDYLVLVSEINNDSSNYESLRTMVYKSSDSGESWSTHEMLLDGQSVKGYDGDVCGVLVLKNGRIITHISTADTNRTCKIVYSDDNGLTWTQANWLGNPTMHTEPAWCELSDGTIVAYFRKDVGTIEQKPIPAIFTKSTDNGVTWSAPVNSKSILDFTQSNGNMVYCEESKSIEFIHHSRRSRDDGYTSLYVSRALEDDVKNDNFGEQIRIGRLNYCGLQSDGVYGDGGYIGACRDNDKNIFAMYYNGSKTSANLCYLIGKKDGIEFRNYKLNDKNGEKLLDDTIKITKIYEEGNEFTNLTGGWGNGINLGYGSAEKLKNKLRLHSVNINSRKGISTKNKVDLTNIDFIYATIYTQLLKGDANNVGASISLFSVENPTTATEGRVAHYSLSKEGYGIIKCDVRNISGEVYINIAANTTGNANNDDVIMFNCYNVWLESGATYTINNEAISKLYSTINKNTAYNECIYSTGKIYTSKFGKLEKKISIGNGSATLESDCINFNFNDTGENRQGLILNKGISSIGKHYLYIDFDITEKTGTCKFEIVLYDTNNPTEMFANRITSTVFETTGHNNFVLPIGNLNKTFYIGLVISKGASDTGGIDVNINNIFMD